MSPGPTSSTFVRLSACIRPDLIDEFLLAGAGVEQPGAGLERAAIHPHEIQVAVLVGDDLEGQRGDGLVGVGLADLLFVRLFGVGVRALDGAAVPAGREVVDHPVQQRLHAHAVQARPAEHRLQGALQRRRPQAGPQLIDRQVVGFQIGFGEGVAGGRDGLQQLRRHSRVRSAYRSGIGPRITSSPSSPPNVIGLPRDEVDDPLQRLRFGQHRDRDGDRGAVQAGFDLAENPLEVRPDAVQLVDKADAGHVILIGLPPDGFALRLHALDRAEHDRGAVQHAQGCAAPPR